MNATEPEYCEDYEICPHCGHEAIRWEPCREIGCDDGVIDLYEDDPLWYDPGDIAICQECHGTGIVKWCPQCGKDPRNTKEVI